jgi:hypothetical protein
MLRPKLFKKFKMGNLGISDIKAMHASPQNWTCFLTQQNVAYKMSHLLTAARTLPWVAKVTLPHLTKTSQKGDDSDLWRRSEAKTASAKITSEDMLLFKVDTDPDSR